MSVFVCIKMYLGLCMVTGILGIEVYHAGI